MSFLNNRFSNIRDVTFDVFPESKALHGHMVEDIVLDKFDTSQRRCAADGVDCNRLVADLREWVPIVTGLIDIAEYLRKYRLRSDKPPPNSNDIIKIYKQIYGDIPAPKDTFLELLSELARYYSTHRPN